VKSQLSLSLPPTPALSRSDFIVAQGNEAAVKFIDSWPSWPTTAAALYGPPGCGKSHLGSAWATRARAVLLDAEQLDEIPGEEHHAIVVDNVGGRTLPRHDARLFALLNRPGHVLLIGRDAPASWSVLMPDLQSRLQALLAFSLWAPDEALLAALIEKLFADRQLRVAPTVIERVLLVLERSPAAIRDFVERVDHEALAQKRAVSLALVRELLPESA
jgi:chromosomal replication initiation ATPase DnaA